MRHRLRVVSTMPPPCEFRSGTVQPLSPELAPCLRHGYKKEMNKRSECSKYLSHLSVIQLDIVSNRRCRGGGWSAVHSSPFRKCCRAFSVVVSAKTFPVPGTNRQKPVLCTLWLRTSMVSSLGGQLYNNLYLQTLHNLSEKCRVDCLSMPRSGA